MEKLYQDYRDIAEFRLIYITEAHAIDSRRPADYAKEKGIYQQTRFGDRCQTAEMLMKDKQLTIPCLVDNMDNSTNRAYHAHPDRVFLVRRDGKLAVAAARGPRGFKPGLDAVQSWLAEFRRTRKEPALTPTGNTAADKKAAADKQDDAPDGG